MKSIRIGNDIRIEWPIVLSGDVSKLQDLDLTVEVRPSAKIIDTHNYADAPKPREVTVMMNGGVTSRPDIGDGKEHCRPRPCPPHPHRPVPPAPVRLPYHIEDNTLIAMWTADRQFATGDYDIILYAHKNEGGQAVCDQYRFVRLVSHTAEADAPDDSGIEAVIAMQPVTLELSGLSAYEVAVVNGFQGTEEEWLQSLKQPAIDAAEQAKEDIEQFKTETKAELKEDIDNLNANTGVDEYPAFTENEAYLAGDIVNYQGKLYRFTSDHAAGTWTGTDVKGYNIKSDIEEKNEELTNVVKGINYYTQRLYSLSNIKAELEDYTLVYAIVDGQGNIAWGITSDGKVIENLPQSTSDAMDTLKQELISILQPKDKTRDDLFGVIDENNNIAFLIDKDGSINIGNIINNGKGFYIVDGQGNIAFLIDQQGITHSRLNKMHNPIYPDCQIPECMFTVVNDCYNNIVSQVQRTYVPLLRIERITSEDVLIGNGGRCIPLVHGFISMPTENVSSLSISNTLRGRDYDDKNFVFTLYTIKNSVLVDKDIRLLCLGDSLTDADLWTSYIGKLIHMDNIDYKKKMSIVEDKISYRPIGIMYNGGEFCNFTYRDEFVDFTDYNEGRSSWAAATYLRHATLFTWASVTYNNQSKDIKHIAWHVLGLFEKESAEYSGTQEQNDMIRYTCNGQYPITVACLDGWVWNNFRSRCGLGSIEYDDATSEQKNTMLHWLDGTGENNLLDNPDNPFFSRDKVEETKNTDNCYAFDWNTYYNRYKTHSNNGEELEEKGTKFQSNSYVCVPNYIVIELGTNDETFGYSEESLPKTMNDIYKIAELLHNDTGAKVMILQNATPTANFPELSYEQNLAISVKRNNATYYAKKNKILSEKCGNLSVQKTKGIFYCPSYYMQRQSCSYDRQYVEIGTEKIKGYVVADTDIHPNKLGYADIGYEVYSMLCYLLTI